jgi:hypothetical protein
MKARKVLLLVVILCCGGLLEIGWQASRGGRFPHGFFFERDRFSGPSFSFASSERKAVPPDTPLEIENAFGTVRVTSGLAAGEVEITLRSTVYLSTEERARAFADGLHLKTALEGSLLRISTNRQELEQSARDVGFETNLEIVVPPGTRVKAQNEHGAVEIIDVAGADVENSFESLKVEGVTGVVTLKARHGDVEASRVKGPLTISARFGDVEVKDASGQTTLDVQHGNVSLEGAGATSVAIQYGDVKAQRIEGNLEVHGAHTAVEASDVKGRCVVETAFQDIEVSRVGGDARLKTEHGSIRASGVEGALRAEATYDGVTLSQVRGPVEVSVAHGGLHAEGLEQGARITVLGDDVVLDGFRGPVTVDARRGSVELIPTGSLTDAVTVSAANGGIRLEVPPGSRFELDATVKQGELQVSAIPGFTSSQSTSTRVSGRVGAGGSSVKLTAEHGDVTIEPRTQSVSGES